MAIWGIDALESAGVGPNAGIGEILPFFQDYFRDNFGPLEQELGGLFSNNDFITDTAQDIGQKGRLAGENANDIIRRGLGRSGVALTPEQEALMQSSYGQNAALAEVHAANKAYAPLDEGFSKARTAFAGLGADVAGRTMANDGLLQGFEINRGVAQSVAQMRKAIQQYMADTSVAQSQYNADLTTQAYDDSVVDAAIGDIIGHGVDDYTIRRGNRARIPG